MKEWNCDLVIKLTQPSDHDPEDGCRFVVEYSKHRGLYGEAVRSFLAWMVTPEPTVSDIRPSARWEMDWNLDAQKKQVFELAVSGASVREIAAHTKVPKSTVNDWLRRERGKKR